VKIVFLLHLYQPSIQVEAEFNTICTQVYFPLIKYIKNKKNFSAVLSIPLSLIEQMDRYGHKSFIEDVKLLFENERIELTGGAAYHPLLTKIPEIFVEKQIVLNEYGLGYYLGRKSGFEGEASIMIKNLDGFFPPEMALNEVIVRTLNNFKYKWVVADETLISNKSVAGHKKFGIYDFSNLEIKILVRNRTLSNLLSFKRSTNPTELIDCINNLGGAGIVSLDSEMFGHHYERGITLLDNFIDELINNNIQISSMKDYLESEKSIELDEIRESSWGATDKEMESGEIYPFWDDKANELQQLLWQAVYKLLSEPLDNEGVGGDADEEYETLPVWDEKALLLISDELLRRRIDREVLLCKLSESDQFWWASKKEILGHVMYDPEYIKSVLNFYSKVSVYSDNEAQKEITDIKSKILDLLQDNNENS